MSEKGRVRKLAYEESALADPRAELPIIGFEEILIMPTPNRQSLHLELPNPYNEEMLRR